MDWQPIESAPKDGTVILTRRIFNGRNMGEHRTVWGTFAADADMRKWGDGGLDGPIPPNPEFADQEHWMREDRMYRVPEPTHWRPEEPPHPPESIRYAVEETVFLHGMILLHVRGERSESP